MELALQFSLTGWNGSLCEDLIKMNLFLNLVTVLSLVFSFPIYSESHNTENTNPPTTQQTHRPFDNKKTSLSGVQFNCTSQENARLLEAFNQLFETYGWTAPSLVKSHLSNDGTQLNLTLTTGDSDTSTVNLFERKEFAIRPDTDPFTNREGVFQNYQVASQKEIIASLLQHGRLTEFTAPFCSFEKFMEHVKIRQNIVKWGVRAMWKFPEDGETKTNPKFWAKDWSVKSGVKSSDAIADAFVGTYNYEIGCTKACQKIMAQGILDYFKNVSKDKRMTDHLDKITAPTPLDTMEMKVHGSSKKEMVREGTLVDRHFNVPYDNWIPGDWGWIKNTDSESAEDFGFEGCNIVYIGQGKFVVYYESDPDRTIDEALVRVYRWRRDSKEKPINPELVTEIRKDPRDGGLLRDVRDFPKNFTLPLK